MTHAPSSEPRRKCDVAVHGTVRPPGLDESKPMLNMRVGVEQDEAAEFLRGVSLLLTTVEMVEITLL